ncbi:MAG: glucose-1-phosphate thymidylyltransferase RfbA [Flavobacteriaceae bacterium]
MKGIILAGGYGSRLYPLTLGTSKQLLPVYDKPMIYYPLSTFMHAGIRDILIISTTEDLPSFKNLLNDGSEIGLNISYAQQKKPNGIAESLIIGSDFIGKDNVCLILGDNIFHGNNFISLLDKARLNLEDNCSTIFGVEADNPNDFGVIEFDSENKIHNIVEKPDNALSKVIVSGLYYYTNDVVKIAKNLKPSLRGELEITDINNHYLSQNKLRLVKLDSETSWIDTGTYDSLIQASKYFQDYENKTTKKVACIEEIALSLGYIDKMKLISIANSMKNSNYGKYLLKITRD